MRSLKLSLGAIVGSMLLCSLQGYAQTIIAHRGASGMAPENTVAAVKLGFELAEAVEIDIHLSQDQKIVVNHDHTTSRTAPGSNFVIKETHSDSLRTLDVGTWKYQRFKGEKIPFIEEVFEVVPEDKTLVIEVKGDTAVLPFLKQAVQNSGKQDQFFMISFNKDAVVQWSKMMPEMPVLWLLHSFEQYSLNEAINIAIENELMGLNVFHQLVTPDFVSAMKEAGLKIFVYTVNDHQIAQKLQEIGVDGITTDLPWFIREKLNEQVKP